MFSFKKQKALEARVAKIEEARAEAAKLEKQKTCTHRWLYTHEYDTGHYRYKYQWSRECRCCGLYQEICEVDVIKDLCKRNGVDIYQQMPKHDLGWPYELKLVAIAERARI